MNPGDYDNPQLEQEWLARQRDYTLSYLEKQNTTHAGLLDEPSWFVAPYVCLWKAKGVDGGSGYWIITGDLPSSVKTFFFNPSFLCASVINPCRCL
jgi:hypothetical protein